MREQYPQKLNVWAGILNNELIRPFFIEGNLTAQKYEDKLRNQIIPAINAIVGETFNKCSFNKMVQHRIIDKTFIII